MPGLIARSQVEHNPLVNPKTGGLAWAVEYDLNTNAVRALNPQSNSWCVRLSLSYEIFNRSQCVAPGVLEVSQGALDIQWELTRCIRSPPLQWDTHRHWYVILTMG